MKEVYLFVTGELANTQNLEKILNEKVIEEDYNISGFESKTNNIKRAYLIENKQKKNLKGKILKLNEKQICILDMWKKVPSLERKFIQVQYKNKKIELYYYTSILEENLNHQKAKKENSNIIEETEKFQAQLEKNKLKYVDTYLMIPCSIENYKGKKSNLEGDKSIINECKSKEINTNKQNLGEYFIESVKENNIAEFESKFVKCLEREVIGKFNLTIHNKNEETCYVTLTKHEQTNLGIVIICIPDVFISVHSLLINFVINNIKIEINEEQIYIKDWLSSMGIEICGSLKSVVFSQENIEKENIINLLACESEPMGKIIGKEFEEMLQNNIAQYNTAEVYVSERCLLEISKNFDENIYSRIARQAIEIFFMELIMLQEAAISRICDKISKQLNYEVLNPAKNDNLDVLDKLACEMSQAILFLDYDCFIFPTVKISAKKIAKSFGIDDLMNKYKEYKIILEKLIDIHTSKVEKVENDITDNILMILTVTQVLPVLVELFNYIINEEITLRNSISIIGSATSCCILFVIFNFIKRRRLKKKFKN